MTADIQRQIAVAKGQKPPATPRTPAPKGKTHPAVVGERVAQEKPAFTESPGAPCTYLVGSYALAVGGRLHAEQMPDRIRIVITGPASEELPAALVAALAHFAAAHPK